ncbi:MAG: multidrug transporter [Cyclobacteriaceae bacterium]
MQAGKRYTLFQTVFWTKKYIFIFLILDSIPVVLYHNFKIEWLHIPWQPISLLGIAVAFYLGFKNNSSYERLWEARKIWGGIVNASRSFTVMIREFVNNDEAKEQQSESSLSALKKTIAHRHVAWLRALTLELRKLKPWEHDGKIDQKLRKMLDLDYREDRFDILKEYLSAEDYEYIMTKGNRSSHIMSRQSKHLMELRQAGIIEHFRHLELQALITEFYSLQGKSERIKNFPFPRQYATVNYFFVVTFIILLPFGMLDVFTQLGHNDWIWFAIPFSVLGSWVFWMMEVIGDFSENPFEGLYNDVPITQLATGIEIDIRQMLDETDLPDPIEPYGDMKILI